MEKDIKLSKEQLQKIKDYLNNNNVEYIDLHLEVLDHISTDIELLMEKVSFEEAFKQVKLKWNKNFRKTSSLWLGVINERPEIIMNKCIKIYKPLFIKFIALIIVFAGLSYIVNHYIEYSLAEYEKTLSIVIAVALLFYTGVILFWYFKMKFGKMKTTFSYLYRIQILPSLFSVVLFNPFLNDSYITKENTFNVLMATMYFIFFLTAIGANYLFKKHKKSVSNYKKHQLK